MAAIGGDCLWVVLLLHLVAVVTLVRVRLLAVAGRCSHGGGGEVLLAGCGVVIVGGARLCRLRSAPDARHH